MRALLRCQRVCHTVRPFSSSVGKNLLCDGLSSLELAPTVALSLPSLPSKISCRGRGGTVLFIICNRFLLYRLRRNPFSCGDQSVDSTWIEASTFDTTAGTPSLLRCSSEPEHGRSVMSSPLNTAPSPSRCFLGQSFFRLPTSQHSHSS